ncbi:MAG: methylenetetrahydrofolate reductase [Dehalococcoidia bacterium]|nr:methylenetetrahydrofolate reductase [Dehalococcoidia bacterium]
MSFPERLAAGTFPVALEITPPQAPLPRVLLRRARLLGDAACAINVIQRPNRQTSLEASIELIAAGLHPVWHLVTRGRGRDEIVADLKRAAAGGVRQLLVIRGDHRAADAPGAPTIRETVALAREHIPGAAIGATLNQYVADRAAVLRNLFPKLEAGASYVQTQPVFDLEALRPYGEALRERHPGTAIVAMAMPLLELDAADRIESRLKLALPTSLRSRIEAGPEEAWAAFDELIAALAKSDIVDGLAIMTFEMDPSPEAGTRIVEALRKADL